MLFDGRKSPFVHIDLVLLFTFLFPWDCWIYKFFENRVALNLALGSVKDVASAIIPHYQKASLLFSLMYFQKIPFSDTVDTYLVKVFGLKQYLCHDVRKPILCISK